MTKKQKIELLRCTKRSFKTRLNSLQEGVSIEEQMDEYYLERKSDLEQCLRFCEYLEMILLHNRSFDRENIRMLEYIGLPELYETQTEELN